MNATHTRASAHLPLSLGPTAAPVLLAALPALFLPLASASAESEESPELVLEWTPQGVVTSPREETVEESKSHKSLDLGNLSPLPLRKLGIFSGYYEFDEGVEDQVVGARDRREVSFANRAHIQTEYLSNPDLERRNGFVGLWASFPIRDPKVRAAEQADAGEPQSYERLRTRRDVPTDPVSQGQGQDPDLAVAESSKPSTPPNPLEALFNLPNPFKPKPNLIPTSGARADSVSGSASGEEQPRGSADELSPATVGSASENEEVPGAEAAASEASGEVADAGQATHQPEERDRFLGIFPVQSKPEKKPEKTSASDALQNLGRKLFGSSSSSSSSPSKKRRRSGHGSRMFRR